MLSEKNRASRQQGSNAKPRQYLTLPRQSSARGSTADAGRQPSMNRDVNALMQLTRCRHAQRALYNLTVNAVAVQGGPVPATMKRRIPARSAGRRYQFHEVIAIATRPALPCRAPEPLPRPVPRRRVPGNSDASRNPSASPRCSAALARHRVATREANPSMPPGGDAQTAHHGALPPLCAPGQRVPSAVAAPAGTTTRS